MSRSYAYVGPEEIRVAAASSPPGTQIRSITILVDWLARNPEALTEGATFVVDPGGVLRLAPRRSEHVACAGGGQVLAAGEIRFGRSAAGLAVVDISNQSTGYCPDVTSWEAVRRALDLEGLEVPAGYTHPIVFRRCPACAQLNVVKEDWFVSAMCDADLPPEWNVG